MNRLNNIHDIIYGSLRPWHRDNLMKSYEYWKEKTVDTKKETPFNNSLFFSPRLRCYQSLIDFDIDLFISEASKTVETTKSENIALLKMKDTREAVAAFAKAAIAEQRMTGIKPDDILNDNADLFEQQDKKETFIIMDYMIVALARCYFSMQDVCSKALSDDRSLDLATFCTSILGRQRLSLLEDYTSYKKLIGDNTPVDIKKTPKAKKVNDDTSPYTVNYSYSGSDRPLRLNLVMQMLIAAKWIAADTTPDNFFDFFGNKVWHCNIKWTASAAVLSTFLDELSKQPFIKLRKKCTMALIAKNQFGKSFDYRGATDEDKIELINKCISILNPKCKLTSYSPDFDDDDPTLFMKAQIHDAGFETRKNGHWAKI